ncbi:MAG: FGGY-family carbohydrate kinase [Aestuariivirga sp.]|uniref:FGGY-family carbohydrate kinase n=1 Tax=Aestuariivirga sp. TaxID=2650926 RepID=UPI0025B991BA|nr:FGGY-family carbohydrate kinase [Aestuariivirga sp.]MCA3560020.1 FGGY-family carbohydrate kinase [Aestuariivirga sp.]
MTDVVLGIDIGTSGVRIAATDGNNTLKAMATAPIAAPIADFGRARQDPQLWWNATLAAFATLKLDGLHVRAIAIDGTSGTILAVNSDGSPASLGSMYNDVCDNESLARIAAVAPRETAALGSTSPLARAMELVGKGTRILHQADWILGKLSGRYDVTDENNALKSGYDPIARDWPRWIARTGFDLRLFPAVVPAGARIGNITAGIAAQLGLPETAAIVAGTTDGCAAFLASGASEPGDGVTSLGTTLTLKLLSAEPVFAPDFGIYSHRIGGQWLAGGASNTGGAAIGAYFSKDDIARLTPLLQPDQSTGLDYYPLPKHGERFPINDPNFQPRLAPRPADDRIFFQGILEGIARIEAEAYAKLGELGASTLKSIRSAGGGSANAAWTAIRLKALGVPEKPSLSEHAAVGTARLAWRGIGHVN